MRKLNVDKLVEEELLHGCRKVESHGEILVSGDPVNPTKKVRSWYECKCGVVNKDNSFEIETFKPNFSKEK